MLINRRGFHLSAEGRMFLVPWPFSAPGKWWEPGSQWKDPGLNHVGA